MVVLIGMLGLVIDGGLLMAAHRRVQNVADTAAQSAAFDKLQGYRNSSAERRAVRFVNRFNLPNATAAINIPPTRGPFVGLDGYAEAVIDLPVSTFFIHALPGVGRHHSVTAHAVAGAESVSVREILLTLDPNVRPGLRLEGNGDLEVVGAIHVNSEGGGLDENGDTVNGNGGFAIELSGSAIVRAQSVLAVGGVDQPDNIRNIVSDDPPPLDADTNPATDPLLYLRTPTTVDGVVDVDKGSPRASAQELALNNPQDDASNPNYYENPGQKNETMILRPGIYESIHITGGRVRFEPGIYVLRPETGTSDALVITGGIVTVQGVMFYNTGTNYQPVYGSPDDRDHGHPPHNEGNIHYGAITINAGLGFTGINTSTYSYDPPVSDAFNGMLIYQRRWNESPIRIEGNSDSDEMVGTVYARWAPLTLVGEGVYDTQIVVGSLTLAAGGDITIQQDINRAPEAPRVFLVE